MKKNLAEVLQQDDVQSELLFHQGCSVYYAGNKQEAIRLFEESLKLCPDNQNAKSALEQLKK
ncbi:MAG: tetratricopeptide repeat protein [Candidatus Pacebacteria bacterium]|nr:tetratricopeptide repeat protein [Candidatus Paceibacterota bacterium]